VDTDKVSFSPGDGALTKKVSAPERLYIKRQSDRIINSGCATETLAWRVNVNLRGEVTFTRKSLDHGGC